MADEILANLARELLSYDPKTGFFARKVRTASLHKVGDRADRLQPRGRAAGYYYVSFGGKRYSAHRTAWLYVHGCWPMFQIDHINGQPGDNRIENLRDVPQSQNQRNRHKSVAASGFMGVSHKQGRWMAALTVNGRQVYLGYHDTPEQAHLAYLEGKKKHHAGYAQ